MADDQRIKNIKYVLDYNHLVKTIKIAAFLIFLVAVFVMIGGYMNPFECSLSDYKCVFSLLLKMAGVVAALFIGYRLLL